VLKNHCLLPEFLEEHRIDIELINETHLQPTKKWSISAYTTIYGTEDIENHMKERP
jgi:hypothetical protein